MLPCLHTAAGGICEMVDVPVPERHLHTTYAQFRYTDKAIKGAVRSPEAVEDTLAMARLVFGERFVVEN